MVGKKGMLMSISDIYESVLRYDQKSVMEGVEKEFTTGSPVENILNDGLISAMDEVGRRFSAGDIFVPEMLMAAQVMKGGLEKLKPHLSGNSEQQRGTVVIGTVKGDLHDIGKNLVAMMFEGGGFTVVDLGVDVDADQFVSAAKESSADVVALSALLTTTLPAMENTVTHLKEAGIENTIVGGAPVTQEFAESIGAAGFSPDAPGAVLLARELARC